MKEYNIRILRADNGWVICNQRVEGEIPKMRVVHEDCDLAGEVAAALVSDKLEGRTIQGYNNIESIERALVKLAKYERDEKEHRGIAQIAANAGIASGNLWPSNWSAQMEEQMRNSILRQQYANAVNPNIVTKLDNTST